MIKREIIVYYSYGVNTKSIANMIKELKDYDLCEIEPVVPYTTETDYQKR